MNTQLLSVALFLGLLLGSGVAAQEERTKRIPLEIAVFEYPPLYHTSVSRNFSGVIGETIKQICLESGLDCHFRMRPVSRAYLELEKGMAQALITVKFDRFKGCCVESEWSYPWRSGLFSKRSVDEIPTGLVELTGKSLILIEGWQSPYTFFPTLTDAENDARVTIHRANSSTSALRMLQKNRGLFLWGGEEFFWHLQQLNMKNVNFMPLLEVPMVVWFSREDGDIRRRFNTGFRKLQSKGLLDGKNVLIQRLMIDRYEEPLLSN